MQMQTEYGNLDHMHSLIHEFMNSCFMKLIVSELVCTYAVGAVAQSLLFTESRTHESRIVFFLIGIVLLICLPTVYALNSLNCEESQNEKKKTTEKQTA